eukprot:6648787-Pyramimonas_sp.AAC.1
MSYGGVGVRSGKPPFPSPPQRTASLTSTSGRRSRGIFHTLPARSGAGLPPSSWGLAAAPP